MQKIRNSGLWIGTESELSSFTTAYTGMRFFATDTLSLYVLYDGVWRLIGPSGGGSGTPSNAVVTETSYGQSSSAGAAAAYSRGDHTHGTPALPTIPQSNVTNLVSDLAGKEPANSNIQTHVGSTANPHSTTAAQVGALATTAYVGLAKITVAADAPVGPSTGDLWIDI